VPWFALLLTALELTPAQCFARFADHLDANPPGDITALQRSFVLDAFRDRPNPRQGHVAADLATFFGRSGALAEAAPAAPRDSAAGPLRLSPQACFAAFEHDPEALLAQLGAGITELEDLSFMLAAQPCEAIVYLRLGEPGVRTLSAAEAGLLRRVTGGGALDREDAAGREFVQTLIADGIIISATEQMP
jgi:hypothetical protein